MKDLYTIFKKNEMIMDRKDYRDRIKEEREAEREERDPKYYGYAAVNKKSNNKYYM
jgi:hypothetical protein